MRVDAGTVVVHLNVDEESAICGFGIVDCVAAEEQARIVMRDLDIDPDLRPLFSDQSPRLLPHVVRRGLEDDTERRVVELSNSITIGIQHSSIVQQSFRQPNALSQVVVVGS